MLRPIEMMWRRVELARHDADTTLFMDLLYAGEMLLRLSTAAFVAFVQEDRESHRYRLMHKIVRADGIGEWSQALEEVLNGTASQHLHPALRDARREFTERFGPEAWQYQSAQRLHSTLKVFVPEIERLPSKLALRHWLSLFPVLRNKTRGHGAPTPSLCSQAAPLLEESIRVFSENASIFQLPWVYLHRNLSGKYRVLAIGEDIGGFSDLRKTAPTGARHANLSDGVYISAFGGEAVSPSNPSRFAHVELIKTTPDLLDFFLPNGNFSEKGFEWHSLVTDSRIEGDSSPYMTPAGERPKSETQGKAQLDIVGGVMTNLPPSPGDYVTRPLLELELLQELKNDRHAIVTLLGRGGIGKTSLALRTLHEIAAESEYEYVFWFSARDIDLLPSGPKIVKPQILTEKDIAEEFVALVGPVPSSGVKPAAYLEKCLRGDYLGKCLYVFDNFETVRSPADLFNWIDMHVRLPNKVLITSRFREFRADYPIEIGGMERDEGIKLIRQTAARLGIGELLNDTYRDKILDESDGHPYVIKIILGEIADKRSTGRPERIVARKEEILDALFERTFANLSPAGRRLFLTLSAWRSLVPELALEAVLLRPENELFDVGGAIDELLRMSLVERTQAADKMGFLSVPYAAAAFGQKKLVASPIRSAIEADIKLLKDVGPTTESGLREGVKPSVIRLFRELAAKISDGKLLLADAKPILELVARSYSLGWLMLADLYEEQGADTYAEAAECVRRFIESGPAAEEIRYAWERLGRLYMRLEEHASAGDALVKAIESGKPPFFMISNTANWLNVNRSILSSPETRDNLFGRVSRLMENRVREATATDLSRLAWLYMPRDTFRARELALQGLKLDPANVHCMKLIQRLNA